MLGISSVYYSKRSTDGGRLLDELAALGFDGVELEYRVRPETLRQMGRAPGSERPGLQRPRLLPDPGPRRGEGSGANAFLFSVPRPRGARRRPCGTASPRSRRPSASARGRSCCTSAASRSTEELLAEYRRLESAAGPATPELLAAVAAVAGRRASGCAAPHLDAVLRSLDRLNREAVRRGLLLGVENRYHPHEIPLPRRDRRDPARVRRRRGALLARRRPRDQPRAARLLTQRGVLEAYGPRLAGTHLHDIRGGGDHLAPGTGEADFAADPAPPAGGRDQDPGAPPERAARGGRRRAGPAARLGY